MKSLEISFINFFIIVFFLSCTQGGTYDYLSSIKDTNIDSDDGRRRLRDSIRDRTLRNSSDYCRESEDCKEVCDSLYLKASDLDRCYNARENRVDEIAGTFDILINPRRLSELNDIEDEFFSDFLNLGYRGFLDLVDPIHIDEDGDRRDDNWEDIHSYDSRTAQLVLEWMAEEEKIAKALQSKDKDDEIFRHLICLLGQQHCTTSKFKNQLCDSNVKPATNALFISLSKPEINCEDPVSCSVRDCHDNLLPIVLGLTNNSFDGVTLYTYSKAQDNDSLSDGIIDRFINNECENSSGCIEDFYCLILHIEDRESISDGRRTYTRRADCSPPPGP